jgi:hypothetical protein
MQSRSKRDRGWKEERREKERSQHELELGWSE